MTQRFITTGLLKAAFFIICLPHTLTSPVFAQTCDPQTLKKAVQELANSKTKVDAQITLQGCEEAAIVPLTEALSSTDPTLRLQAAQTLGSFSTTSDSAVSALIAVAEDDLEVSVRSEAVKAISSIARIEQSRINSVAGWRLDKVSNIEDFVTDLNELIGTLRQSEKEWTTKSEDLDSLRLSKNGLQNQLAQLKEKPIYHLSNWIIDHHLGIGIPILLFAIYGAFYLFFPLILLKLDKIPKAVTAALPDEVKPLGNLLEILLPFKYCPRVLNAWVKKHQKVATRNFFDPNNRTVADRAIHLSMPVKQDGRVYGDFEAIHLRPYFEQKRLCLLIQGEGGAGKTSLACQIARWGIEGALTEYSILPILIEKAIPDEEDFLDRIQGLLQSLVESEERLDKTFVEALLRQKRVLVIVDHFSEMPENTRKKIDPSSSDFCIHAFVMTSRLSEQLGGASKKKLEPLRIQGENLSRFMNAYLEARGKRELFDDEDYFDACRKLSTMVGQRNITLLLARLYADQLVERQTGYSETLPENIPELMLSYLNRINQAIEPENRRSNIAVQEDMVKISWICLEQNYFPTPVARDSAQISLDEVEDASPEQRLTYLEKRLRLVRSFEPDTHIKVEPDPLAEYLAGIYLVQQLRNNESHWEAFFFAVDDKPGYPEKVAGFLLALHDICQIKQRELQIPDWAIDTLADKGGLDVEALARIQRKRRIRSLISDLTAPEAKYRMRAVEDLGEYGRDAIGAIPDLVKLHLKEDEELTIRRHALLAIKKIGPKDVSIIPILVDALHSTDVVISAITASIFRENIKLSEVVIPTLIEKLKSQNFPKDPSGRVIRQTIFCAAAALVIGGKPRLEDHYGLNTIYSELMEALISLGEKAVPDLIQCLESKEPGVRNMTFMMLRRIKSEAKEAVPALLLALESDDIYDRRQALFAMVDIAPTSLEVMKSIKEVFEKDNNPVIVHTAFSLLQKVVPYQKIPLPNIREEVTEQLLDGVSLKMLLIPEGGFSFGSPEGENGSQENEKPQHRLLIAPFLMGQCPVTQAQWKAVSALPRVKIELERKPSYFNTSLNILDAQNINWDKAPVENISWYEAVEFCARLSAFTGRQFRLPTEAEWEFACRARSTTPFYSGQDLAHPPAFNYFVPDDSDHALDPGMRTWEEQYKKYIGSTVEACGTGGPNDFGLYGMHGNVWEWCLDHWHDNYYGVPIDGSAWLEEIDNGYRSVRGGAWNTEAEKCRSASREKRSASYKGNDTGFRVVCTSIWEESNS